MKTFDIQKEYRSYYTANEQPELVDIGEATYVSIAGKGRPGTNLFYEKKKAIKVFVAKLQMSFANTEKAFTSSVIEIFYWYDEEKTGFVDIGNFYTSVDLDLLQYRIAIRIPDNILNRDIDETVKRLTKDKFAPGYERFVYTAEKCVQVLHSGPFAGELETLPVLQRFATEKRLRKWGMHHEIHLVNFERGQSQSHLKTILRDPVKEKIS